jgi:hypothetical protein
MASRDNKRSRMRCVSYRADRHELGGPAGLHDPISAIMGQRLHQGCRIASGKSALLAVLQSANDLNCVYRSVRKSPFDLRFEGRHVCAGRTVIALGGGILCASPAGQLTSCRFNVPTAYCVEPIATRRRSATTPELSPRVVPQTGRAPVCFSRSPRDDARYGPGSDTDGDLL